MLPLFGHPTVDQYEACNCYVAAWVYPSGAKCVTTAITADALTCKVPAGTGTSQMRVSVYDKTSAKELATAYSDQFTCVPNLCPAFMSVQTQLLLRTIRQ